MPVMTNAEAFEYDFGIYATELWSMTEEQFLTWLNAECDRERPRDMIVRCKDCKYSEECHKRVEYTRHESATSITIGFVPVEYCSRGERKDDV